MLYFSIMNKNSLYIGQIHNYYLLLLDDRSGDHGNLNKRVGEILNVPRTFVKRVIGTAVDRKYY